MGHDNYLINIDSINNIDDVIKLLQELDIALHGSPHPSLLTFNQAYLQITTAVKEAIGSKFYQDAVFMDRFCVNFAIYYFKAINQMITHDKKLSKVWSKALISNNTKLIPLLIGANAHINYDLCQALNDSIESDKANLQLQDFIKTKSIIRKTMRQFIKNIEEKNRVLNYFNKHTIWLYFNPFMLVIAIWRRKAINNYLRIKRNDLDKTLLENRVARKATLLLSLDSLFIN